MPDATNPFAQRFFREHLHDVSAECRIWPYAKNSTGYGCVRLDGRLQQVHVLACEAANGPCPPGMEAAHGPCHNRRCWNPAHLSWETRAQNSADRRRDGTWITKLTADQVRKIRAAYAAGGVSMPALAATYGVSYRLVWNIVHRKAWRHV